MKTVWKFPLIFGDISLIEVPLGAEPLSVGRDPQGNLSLWALVDPHEHRRTQIRLRIAGTGHPVYSAEPKFLGTIHDGDFVWHVFQEV